MKENPPETSPVERRLARVEQRLDLMEQDLQDLTSTLSRMEKKSDQWEGDMTQFWRQEWPRVESRLSVLETHQKAATETLLKIHDSLEAVKDRSWRVVIFLVLLSSGTGAGGLKLLQVFGIGL